MYIFSPRLRLLSLFVLAYLLIGFAFALILKNYEFLIYEVEMVLILALLVFMDRRVKFSPLVLWGLAIWGMLHLAGGMMPIPASVTEPGAAPVLYNLRLVSWLPKYDQYLHAFGFGICAIAAHESLQAHLGRALPISLPIAACLILIAAGLGTINEMIEFAVSMLISDANVGGYINTSWDLVSNAAGAAIAVLYLRYRS